MKLFKRLAWFLITAAIGFAILWMLGYFDWRIVLAILAVYALLSAILSFWNLQRIRSVLKAEKKRQQKVQAETARLFDHQDNETDGPVFPIR